MARAVSASLGDTVAIRYREDSESRTLQVAGLRSQLKTLARAPPRTAGPVPCDPPQYDSVHRHRVRPRSHFRGAVGYARYLRKRVTSPDWPSRCFLVASERQNSLGSYWMSLTLIVSIVSLVFCMQGGPVRGSWVRLAKRSSVRQTLKTSSGAAFPYSCGGRGNDSRNQG